MRKSPALRPGGGLAGDMFAKPRRQQWKPARRVENETSGAGKWAQAAGYGWDEVAAAKKVTRVRWKTSCDGKLNVNKALRDIVAPESHGQLPL